MYETEVNLRKESAEQIPLEILARWKESKETVLGRTVLPWSEHCTECAWPSCYSTCEFYRDRSDGRCRRFANGMTRLECPDALNSYLLKITFMQWAKLWTPGNIRLHQADAALRIENRDYRIGSALQQFPLPHTVRNFTVNKRYSLKKKLAYGAKQTEQRPNSFLLECYNPGTASVNLSFSIRPAGKDIAISFQKLITLDPGFHRIRIPYKDISAIVNLEKPFHVELIPNHYNEQVTLYFGLMDFVHEVQQPDSTKKHGTTSTQRKIKCVVWDLDNTIWDGILIEDGREKLVLKPNIRQVLEELDRRGILLSIASKNNPDEALAVLREMSLDELFLCPQISWGPKSAAIQKIAQQLNIGFDTILFVDDSTFEREQVASVHSEVRVMDARDYMEIQNLEECKVPVTAESRERRKMYRMESERQSQAAQFAGDYIAFLNDCNIRMNITSLGEENLERVHELSQRTNQMNFSGNRYDRNVLKQIITNPSLDTYVLEVEDRFGSYGIVGFSIVDNRKPLITDLMFSCRVQSKRVEHAFLAWVVRKYIRETGQDMWAIYRRTERNAPAGKVFEDLAMKEVAIADGVSTLVFPSDQPIPEDGIVQISVQTREAVS